MNTVIIKRKADWGRWRVVADTRRWWTNLTSTFLTIFRFLDNCVCLSSFPVFMFGGSDTWWSSQKWQVHLSVAQLLVLKPLVSTFTQAQQELSLNVFCASESSLSLWHKLAGKLSTLFVWRWSTASNVSLWVGLHVPRLLSTCCSVCLLN